jgi:TonB family protein
MKLIDSPYSLSLTHERRRARRRKVDAVVYVNIGRDNGGVLLDLSEDGMCISVANPLAVSSEVQFDLGLEEARPIEGTAQVSWLSESGRSAGIRFLSLPNESRMRIRQWLAGTPALTKKSEATVPSGNTGTATQEPAAALREEASGQRETGTAAIASRNSEYQGNGATLHSPLFFLPKRPAADELSEEFSSQPQPYTWRAEKTGPENEGETVQAFRAAIVAKPERDEQDRPEERRFKKAVIVCTVCLLLLATGVAALVAYPKRFAELRQFTASLKAPWATVPAAPVKPRSPERRMRRGVKKEPMFVASGPQRGSHPVRDSAIFDSSSDGGSQFAAGADSPSQRRWLARASGPSLTPKDETTDNPSATPASDFITDGDGAASSTPITGADSQSTTKVGSLRVDGGLVEEGSVNPTFAPLNLDGQTLDSKPVVVEAVIGTDGAVKEVRLVSSPASSLAQTVVAAVRQWRYRPFYRNGRPIEFVTRITVDFERSAPKQ